MAKLLLVEDNAILATTLERFLHSQSELSEVAIAPSAEAALEKLRHMVVDLVLVDVALPGINGIDFVALLRKSHPTLPCLMLSGHNEIDYVGRALAAGAKGYVVKSDPLSILDAVKRVLNGETYLSEELQKKNDLRPS